MSKPEDIDAKIDKELSKAVDMLSNLVQQVKLMSAIQISIVSYLGDKDEEFRAAIISEVLSIDKYRENFTEFLEKNGASDEVKLQMLEINEGINDLRNGASLDDVLKNNEMFRDFVKNEEE